MPIIDKTICSGCSFNSNERLKPLICHKGCPHNNYKTEEQITKEEIQAALRKNLDCDICPNAFECPLMKYPKCRRDKLCLVRREPIDYSNNNLYMMIPETKREWANRLHNFLSERMQ